jgi:hypothetical protein
LIHRIDVGSTMASDSVFHSQNMALLAAHASLPLAPERAAAVAAILDIWGRDANALSERMSDPALQTLMPATVFVHPAEPGEGDA